YMLRMPGEKYNGPTEIREIVTSLSGEKAAEEFYNLYYQHYVAEKDIKIIASWGANTIRVPFTWKLFMEEKPPYGFIDRGFELIELVVRWCEKYGLYVILDMHCAPGAQNEYNIADSDGTARLFSEPDIYWPLTITLWKELASRYADDTIVIGYDLLNEPLGNLPSTQSLKDLYMEITAAIRKVDPWHILFIEGGKWAQDFTYLVPPWDNNMVYTFHRYPPPTHLAEANSWLVLREKYDVPLWLGETGENTTIVYKAATHFLTEVDVGVNWWTHKKVEAATSPYSSPLQPGYQRILNFLAGTGPKPSPEEAEEGFLAQARALAIDNCRFFPDIVESFGLTPHEYPDQADEFPVASIPGKIEAENYNEYFDITPGNSGGIFRRDDVDIEFCLEGGYNVGWIDKGEWLAYNVKVEESGNYTIEIRISCMARDPGTFYFEIDNKKITGSIALLFTGGWQSWTTIVVSGVGLEMGDHLLRFVSEGDLYNLNWFCFIKE
ncbi:MAG: cellulase family glycosylhydrolase, partial [Spirochaetales bacterium]|nr:cellulase family glycosylhydrolase [Spirochaetales bacterium]